MGRILGISVKGPDGVVRSLEEDAALRRKEKKATLSVDFHVAKELKRLAKCRSKRISPMLDELIKTYKVAYRIGEAVAPADE